MLMNYGSYDYVQNLSISFLHNFICIEACDVITSRGLDVTTTREIVASSEEIRNIRICKLNS